MKDDFTSAFADFLENQLGEALFSLREKNEEYCKLSDEYAVLLNGKYQSIEEYRQVVSKIKEIGDNLADIEKRALFLAGMREHTKIENALLLDSFEKFFVS